MAGQEKERTAEDTASRAREEYEAKAAAAAKAMEEAARAQEEAEKARQTYEDQMKAEWARKGAEAAEAEHERVEKRAEKYKSGPDRKGGALKEVGTKRNFLTKAHDGKVADGMLPDAADRQYRTDLGRIMGIYEKDMARVETLRAYSETCAVYADTEADLAAVCEPGEKERLTEDLAQVNEALAYRKLAHMAAGHAYKSAVQQDLDIMGIDAGLGAGLQEKRLYKDEFEDYDLTAGMEPARSGEIACITYMTDADDHTHKAMYEEGMLFVDGKAVLIDRNSYKATLMDPGELDRPLTEGQKAACRATLPDPRERSTMVIGAVSQMDDFGFEEPDRKTEPRGIVQEMAHESAVKDIVEGHAARGSQIEAMTARIAEKEKELAGLGDKYDALIKERVEQKDEKIAKLNASRFAPRRKERIEKIEAKCAGDVDRYAQMSGLDENVLTAEIAKLKADIEVASIDRSLKQVSLEHESGSLTDRAYIKQARSLEREMRYATERADYHNVYEQVREAERARAGKPPMCYSYDDDTGREHKAIIVGGMLFIDGAATWIDEETGRVCREDPERADLPVGVTAEDMALIKETGHYDEKDTGGISSGLKITSGLYYMGRFGKTAVKTGMNFVKDSIDHAPI